MKNLFRQNKKGISSVFIAVFLALIVTVLGLSLFSSMQIATNSSIQRLAIEQARNQEAIFVKRGSVSVVNDIIQTITVNNTGSILERISGVYINSKFIIDPSIHLNPQEERTINIGSKGISFSQHEFDTLVITTERGTIFKSIIRDLLPESTIKTQSNIYGPFRLVFEQFYWTYFSDNFDYTYLDSATWHDGWRAPANAYVIYRIVVQNVAESGETITLGNQSCMSILSNKNSNRKALYVDVQTSDLIISFKEYATIYFVWKDPAPSARTQSSAQSLLPTSDELSCMTFLVLNGKIGYTTIMGETIPFEAVLIYK